MVIRLRAGAHPIASGYTYWFLADILINREAQLYRTEAA
ncbi:hemoglobin-like flavoprotein [Sphingomonas sp. BE138]|nr:hemoglobin-like flavoprotein [Sphingomonas sp. BE138]